ncbi:MAG: class I tRNA ligase family protein [Chitinophagaceae bacterium]
MEYNFRAIEKKWQEKWIASQAYKVSNQSSKPKYYVLDMFPYPSGAGLHVGHPLGYIASDIYSRYKRLKGFNVLHPMGFDSFGLPAEQYAFETGQHPATTTENNIATFKSQLDKIGFCYDWDREVKTSEPGYYKWTQWIFLQLFNSYFCNTEKKAIPIAKLVEKYATKGAVPKTGEPIPGKHFTAAQWNAFTKKEQEEILMKRRLAFSSYGEVNWCEALGTVLANDEVVNGVSERGGHPVEKRKMRQWYLRITSYADRLLEGLETVDFSESMKEMQRNWIGKSYGAEMEFEIATEGGLTPASPVGEEPKPVPDEVTIADKTQPLNGEAPLSGRRGAGGEACLETGVKLKVYTTRPDTIFGVDFMVVAPEHDLVPKITTAGQKQAVEEYLTYVKSRSDRERMAEVKQITGCFTGAYAINPFNGQEIPIWIAEYVLAGYGTGAIMAVPCGDQRDFAFAKHFNIPITNIIGDYFNGEEANPTKEATLQNSGFLDGLLMKDAIEVANSKIEELGIGKRKVNYRMRDAGFSRQRYWGEPFPIIWSDGVALPLDAEELPLELPHVEKYGPGPSGEGPLANIKEWVETPTGLRETSTMPGYAGSSWYFLRYMDPHNTETFCDRSASDYWNQVDLYIGGTEHAVGHLLYSRLWTKVLYDLGHIGYDEPFKKLLNQGMIQGMSQVAYVRKSDYEEGKSVGGSNTIFLPAFTNPASTPEAKLQLYSSQVINETNKEHFKEINIPIELVKINTLDSSRNLLDTDLAAKLYPHRFDVILITPKAFWYEGVWRTWKKETSEWKIIPAQDFFTASQAEKMSKSKYNVVNPDHIIAQYGADTFRMYEMFLGPVEVSKPWDTKGIEGVHRFLKKLWRLFFDEAKGKVWNEETPTAEELKVLHKTIKKIEEDTERFSFNTAVSAFMIAVNELMDLKCQKKAILEPLVIMLVPYAPHIAEELYHVLGNETLVIDAAFPTFEEKYIAETAKEYPVSINGKVRTTMSFALDAEQAHVEQTVISNQLVQKWMEGKPHKKIIFVKGRMINVVV